MVEAPGILPVRFRPVGLGAVAWGGASDALAQYEWPGNVRQLANSVEAAVVRAAGAPALEQRHLFPEAAAAPEGDTALSFQEATRRYQRKLLAETLRDTDWNISETSRRLELARSHVHNLILAFDLKRAEAPKPPKKPRPSRRT